MQSPPLTAAIHEPLSVNSLSPGAAPAGAEPVPFAHVLQELLHESNQTQLTAQEQVDKLLAGDDVDIHEVSLQVAQADLSLRFLLEVRERALSAYQDIMRTQM